MPEKPDKNRVIITVHLRGATDEDLTALRTGIRELLAPHPGAVMTTKAVEQMTVPAAEAPEPE